MTKTFPHLTEARRRRFLRIVFFSGSRTISQNDNSKMLVKRKMKDIVVENTAMRQQSVEP